MGNKIGVSGRRTSVAKLMVEATEELCEYKKIGTVEECYEAVEKQKLKKVIMKPWSPAKCPQCGVELSESIGDGYYKHYYNLRRCIRCGQAIKWED